jgi:magnesium-transporting ATPase (P-type)
MSVIGKNSVVEGFEVYAKGSPEMMLKCMSSSSVPKNYN